MIDNANRRLSQLYLACVEYRKESNESQSQSSVSGSACSSDIQTSVPTTLNECIMYCLNAEMMKRYNAISSGELIAIYTFCVRVEMFLQCCADSILTSYSLYIFCLQTNFRIYMMFQTEVG